MSLYGAYKKRCPKRMGIALDDEELNLLFQNEASHGSHQTFKTNPITKRPLSYYNELYDCLSNLNDKNALNNRSLSLDESTFVPNVTQNNLKEEASNNQQCTNSQSSEKQSEKSELLDEIELTVRKLISQCSELSKQRKEKKRKESLKMSCKVEDELDEDKLVCKIDLSSFDAHNKIMLDNSETNINFILHSETSEMTNCLKKELLISFNREKSSNGSEVENFTNQTVNGNTAAFDRYTPPGIETDFYYSIDDINSAVDPDEVVAGNYFYSDKLNNFCNIPQNHSEIGNSSEFNVALSPNSETRKHILKIPDSNIPPHDFVEDPEKNLLSSSDFDDKYQADVSSCEDFARVVVSLESNVNQDKNRDRTSESSESSSSFTTKSGSYLLTDSEVSHPGEGKREFFQNVDKENIDSADERFAISNVSGISLCENSNGIPNFTVAEKIYCTDFNGGHSNSSTSNGVSFHTEDSEEFSNVKYSAEIFAPSEDFVQLSNSISSYGLSSLAENDVGYSNSNTLDKISFRSEDTTGFSYPASLNEVSLLSGNNTGHSDMSRESFYSEENFGCSNSIISNGVSFHSEDSSVFHISSASDRPISQTENSAESSTDNFSEEKTVLVKSESETSISSDIIAWQRDIFLSVLDDSDEDWIIHDRAEWFSSNDYEGRVYFFEENSNESSWTLPEAPDTCNVNESSGNEKESTQEVSPTQELSPTLGKVEGTTEEKGLSRSVKSRSMILLDSKLEELTPLSRNWPQLWNGHMCILQEGSLNRTKITENGKRLRKNWASAYVVLTELFLLFFKDAKSFAAMKNGGWKPELCVDLNGALIDRGEKVSSRKNVFIMSTVLGLQVLIQCDCSQQANVWLQAIQSAIKNLPSGFDNCSRLIRNSTSPECNSPEGGKKAKIGRSKSVKLKNKDGSIEDLTISVAERQTKIRARLKKFFNRRPTMESLVKKGIWKDEPVFGCFLEQVCSGDSPRVPQVVQRCIKCIESSEENMKADGLYRASGNLSQVQKIRLQVDQNNLAVLDQEEDVHVLTGALKLFFRELKEPLIPYHLFSKALKASTSHSRKEKLNCFREITKALPTANHDTLKFLLQHLLRVTKYKEFNRMHIPNLAIVFGPTLMWPAQESTNMALDLMQQNLVIESFLVEFDQIFR